MLGWYYLLKLSYMVIIKFTIPSYNVSVDIHLLFSSQNKIMRQGLHNLALKNLWNSIKGPLSTTQANFQSLKLIL